jgi:hypothetical protein
MIGDICYAKRLFWTEKHRFVSKYYTLEWQHINPLLCHTQNINNNLRFQKLATT